jgi:hypothetical protein
MQLYDCGVHFEVAATLHRTLESGLCTAWAGLGTARYLRHYMLHSCFEKAFVSF